MSRLLLAFGLFEGVAFGAFLLLPLPMEERVPGSLLGWALGCASFFFVVLWPAVEASLREERGLARVAEHGVLLAAACAPFAGAALALAPLPAGEFARAAWPAAVCLVAGGVGAYASVAGGEIVLRLAMAAGVAAFLLGPLGRFHSGASGSLPGDSITVLSRPALALAALLLPALAFALRRLRAGREGEAE